jgi:hypothetical protein
LCYHPVYCIRDYPYQKNAGRRQNAFNVYAQARPLLDTKLDLAHPAAPDFDASDPVRGRDAVYGWIQGRGLEAL